MTAPLLYAGPFAAPSSQVYEQRSGGDWTARLQLTGCDPEPILADTEPALRAVVLARLRAWLPTAGADAMGDLLEALGEPRGRLSTATRRAACEAALLEVESGAWLEVTP
jgi:hypothetical protein